MELLTENPCGSRAWRMVAEPSLWPLEGVKWQLRERFDWQDQINASDAPQLGASLQTLCSA